MTALRRVALACALALASSVAAERMVAHGRPFYQGEAFLAFYCAGAAIAQGEDPYREGALSGCEHQVDTLPAGVVEPAPLPPYALAAFVPLARLPLPAAATVWVAILLSSLCAAGWALARTTGLSVAVVAAALASNAGYLNVYYGELPPLVVAAIALAGLAFARGKPLWAAACALAATIEPHLGIPLCAALLVLAPRARVPLVLGGLAILALGFLAMGPHAYVEYFKLALPAHELAELGAIDQYSLTWILHSAGVADGPAIAAGSASYALMLVAGLVLAVRLAPRSPALALAIPPAAVLVGGPFVHDLQMAAALPAALLIIPLAGAARPWAVAGTVLLAIPWGVLGLGPTGRLAPLVAAALAAGTAGARASAWRRIALGGLALVATFAAVKVLTHLAAPLVAPHIAIVPAPQAIASANWAAYLQAVARPLDLDTLLRKLCVWAGFAVLVPGLVVALRSRADPVASARRSIPARARQARPDCGSAS